MALEGHLSIYLCGTGLPPSLCLKMEDGTGNREGSGGGGWLSQAEDSNLDPSNQECDPGHAYSEVSPIELSGIYKRKCILQDLVAASVGVLKPC